jgi:hypothetical protein
MVEGVKSGERQRLTSIRFPAIRQPEEPHGMVRTVSNRDARSRRGPPFHLRLVLLCRRSPLTNRPKRHRRRSTLSNCSSCNILNRTFSLSPSNPLSPPTQAANVLVYSSSVSCSVLIFYFFLAKAPSVRRACVACHTGKTRCSEVLPCQVFLLIWPSLEIYKPLFARVALNVALAPPALILTPMLRSTSRTTHLVCSRGSYSSFLSY